jgi:hypothetical protein
MFGRLLRLSFVLSALMSILVISGEICGGPRVFTDLVLDLYLAWVKRPLTSALSKG